MHFANESFNYIWKINSKFRKKTFKNVLSVQILKENVLSLRLYPALKLIIDGKVIHTKETIWLKGDLSLYVSGKLGTDQNTVKPTIVKPTIIC